MIDDADKTTTDFTHKYGSLPHDAPWWAKFLVANWRDSMRWWSLHWTVICGALAEAYALYGPEIAKHVPIEYVPHITAAAFWVTAILRFVKTAPKPPVVDPAARRD